MFKNIFPIWLVMLSALLLNCQSTSKDTSVRERAEIESLRRRQALLLRENAIYRDENLGNSRQVSQLNTQLDRKERKIELLIEQTQKIKVDFEKSLEAEQQKNKILSQNSSQRVKELTELNRTQEESARNRISLLLERIKEEEKKYSEQLAQLQKTITDQEVTIRQLGDSKKKETRELQSENENLRKRLEEANATINRIQTSSSAATNDVKNTVNNPSEN